MVKLFTSNRLKPFIYNLTNDCTYILNTTITNNMLLHVSTFKMSSSGSSLCLAKITRTYRFSGLSKIKLLKYKMINFNKMLIVRSITNFILLRPENLYLILARHNKLPEDDILNVETCRSMLFAITVFDITVQSLVNL